MRNPGIHALLVPVVAGIALLSGCGGVDSAPFADKMSAYVSAPVSGTGSKSPAIQPRMLVVEPRTGGIDADVFGGLPDDLTATAPADVGTVVRTRWSNELTGYWTLGDQQYWYDCTVTVIDWDSKKVIAREKFQGEDRAPDPEESATTHRFATDLTDEIVDYLAGLPRR